MSGDCTGNEVGYKLQIRAVSKLKQEQSARYRTETANTLCQGPVATKCKLHEGAGPVESGERIVADGNAAEAASCQIPNQLRSECP